MVKKGWLYGLMVFLAQTCNPYYSANDTRIPDEEAIVEIPAEAFELEEEIEVEPPRNRPREEAIAPPPPPPPPPPPMPEEEQFFKVVEEMPRFPGCEQKAIGRNELKKCSMEEMMKFIGENIKYPEIAIANGIEGTVVLQFVVGKGGDIENVKVLRDLGGGTGAEAVRVVKMMPKWIAGKQRGRPVRVLFTLPVAFKLPTEKPKSKN